MVKATAEQQLMIKVDNQVGTLAEITSVVSSSRINLVAISAHAVDNQGFVMFVTEDNQKAKELLQDKGYDVRDEKVILLTLDNKPGELQAVVEKIADVGVDLTLIYGSVDQKEKVSRIILVSEDNASALVAINVGLEL